MRVTRVVGSKSRSRASGSSRVLIVQRRLTHYRVPFFERLRSELDSRDVDLALAHGRPTNSEAEKRDSGSLPWASEANTTYFLNGRVCWQPFFELARGVDLLVLTHENKLICNLWAQYFLRDVRVALWGHGANLQGSSSSLRERLKKRSASKADWWFGYTEMSRPLILDSGFPADRITIVDNAIDTVALSRWYESVLPEHRLAMRRKLGLVGKRVSVFLGSLYEEKRIDFLVEAAELIRERIPDFELVIAGGGPDACKVEAFCKGVTWARYVGPVSGREKAELLASAHVMLNPGLVGLGILDSLICGVPLVTTDCGLHSPEVAYLESGKNGVMTTNEVAAFVDVVVRILSDERRREELVAGCISSGAKYTLDRMVRRFSDGVQSCLAEPLHRARP